MAKAKMTVCKACGQEIAASAKVCPHCGAKNKKPVFRKWWFWAIIVILLIAALSSGESRNKDTAAGSTETASAEQATETATGNTGEKNTEEGSEELYRTAADSKNMKLGECGKENRFYVGLSGVRVLDYIQTAIDSYHEELGDGQECVYALMEVYNASEKTRTYSDSEISIYADTTQAAKPDTVYMLGVDGYEAFSGYTLDPGTRALVLVGGVVEKGWTELTVYAGNLVWKVASDEITDDTYHYTTMFALQEEMPATEPGTVIHSETCEITYEGFELYTESNVLTGETFYAVFEFTVNNTTDKELDYSLAGYQMRGYCNGTLLEGASYTLDDTIDGYSSIYNVDEIKPGMSAKLYVAFETTEQNGSFACSYDTGYITNETLGYACAEN